MSTINPSAYSAYSSYLRDTQSKINLIKTQLNTGNKIISAADQSTITNLSSNASAYTAVTQSIGGAQSVITSAQKGLTSIGDLLRQMQALANQATNPSLSNLDAINLNNRFQKLVTDIGKIATTASVNGSNLLSGTAGVNVKTGIDNTPASRTHIQPVNIYGMITMGALGGIKLESIADANSALSSIASAIATVNNGQISLKTSAKQLSAKANAINGITTSSQSQLASLQNLDKPALQSQLQMLNNNLAVYTLLSKLG
ncbi:hypothetical protein ICN49_09260 [Polynucleobacter sp. MWH-Mekk-B1]|uniref:flagellin n=1 Tax=Polynucleobacter finlandensis TaxID=1855894 RepID=UPI001C0DB0D4|nr:hypothetical protein [Polynucleobacter finlandensis]MBU3545101.1 hypothetical protein [Polynucleobacter finlandensis]